MYDTPVYESRHPGLSEYIHSVVRAIGRELEESTVRQVILAIYHEDAPDEALEEFVFVLTFLLSDADKRDPCNSWEHIESYCGACCATISPADSHM